MISKSGQTSKVVVGTGFVALAVSAILTAVDESKGAAGGGVANRRHQAAAVCRSIARMVIHMLAPETLWAVVGVAVPPHPRPAVFASEIFLGFFEFPAYYWIV